MDQRCMFLLTFIVASIISISQAIAAGEETKTTSAALGVSDSVTTSQQSTENSGPIALVKGEPLTMEQLTSYTSLLESARQPVDDMNTVVNDLIITKLANEVYTTVPVHDELHAIPVLYPDWSQRSLIFSKLVEKIRTNSEVTTDQMKSWYKLHLAEYQSPERIQARHIFMETSQDEPSSSPEKVRTKLEEIRKQVESGTSFVLMAKQHSEASSGRNGGDIGLVSRRMPIGPASQPMNIKLEEALFALPQGKVSEVVSTSHGLHLLYSEAHLTTSTPSLEDFVTSQILPAALQQDLVTSKITEIREQAIAKHNGKVLLKDASNLTTTTPALEFDGKQITIQHLEQLYGSRFTRGFEMRKGNPAGLAEFMNQVLQDIALIQAGVDAGVDKDPEIKRDLDLLGQRAQAQRRLQSIVAEAYPANEEQARSLYEKNKEAFRRPEIEGQVIVLGAASSQPTPALRARGLQRTQQVAEEALAEVKAGKSFEDVAEKVKSKDIMATVTSVSRHVIGAQTTDTMTRQYDMVLQEVTEPGQVSAVRQSGDLYLIGKLGQKYPGEAPPFDQLRPRFMQQARYENEQAARQDMIRQMEEKGLLKWLPGATRLGRSEP